MERKKWLFVPAIIGVASTFLYVKALFLKDLRANTIMFEYIFFALFALYLAASVFVFFKRLPKRQTLGIVITVAVIARVLMALSTPTLSNDIYRYAWDGKIQTAGYDPYRYSPSDPRLSSLRDKAVYSHIYEKDGASIYPPVSEMFFFASALPGTDPVLLLKLLLSLLDVVSIILLILILKELGIDENRVIFYAWSPLVIFEISHSGHIDGLVVLFILAAIWLRLKDKGVLSGSAAGIAAAAKVFPLIFLPALVKKLDYRVPAGVAVAVAFAYVPYARAETALISLFGSSGGPRFNAGLKHFLEMMIGGQSPAFDTVYKFAAVVVLAVAAIALYIHKDKNEHFVMNGCFIMALLYIVLLPFLAPWYLVFVIPFLAYKPSPAVLYLSGAVMLSYVSVAGAGLHFPEWIRYVEYVPFFALLGYQGIKWIRGFQGNKRISPSVT